MVANMSLETKAHTEVIGEITSGFADTKNGLTRMAKGVARGLALGADVSPEVLEATIGIPVRLGRLLHTAARAQLDEAFYPRLLKLSTSAIKAIGALPAHEQQRLAKDGHVSIMRDDEEIRVPLEELPPDICAAFVDTANGKEPGRIRSAQELAAYLDHKHSDPEDAVIVLRLRVKKPMLKKLQHLAEKKNATVVGWLTERVLVDVMPT